VTTATAGRTVSRGWRTQRLMLVLLVVSLALNLCFIAGAVWTRMRAPPTAAERFQQMGNELNLNAEQRERFQNYVRTMRTRSQSMREETEPLIAAAWADAAKPQPDEPKIARAFDQAADKRRAFQRDSTNDTLAFLATLSPEQRAKFVAIARERRGPWLPGIPRNWRPN